MKARASPETEKAEDVAPVKPDADAVTVNVPAPEMVGVKARTPDDRVFVTVPLRAPEPVTVLRERVTEFAAAVSVLESLVNCARIVMSRVVPEV